jgi:hypothetical protein
MKTLRKSIVILAISMALATGVAHYASGLIVDGFSRATATLQVRK